MAFRTLFLALITLLLGIGSAQAQNAQIGPNAAVAASDTVETEIIVEPILPDFSATELQELVGPIALYPDSLLAIILPASAYPLQIVQAARFLDNLEQDNTLQPDESWDESVIALLNYPEVIRLMDADIDWTWQLGEAVIAQEADVLNAIADFRTLAYDAGNLETDEIQVVERANEVITITQVDEKVVYVPYYEPREVIIYQTRPVYYYYPRRYPVYYYPYDYGYSFFSGYFWGVTTAFSLGWHDHHIHVYHPSYYRHPYYGRYYDTRYHYRRPTINVFNNYYVDNSRLQVRNRARDGSYWRPQRNYGSRPGYDRERRVARTYGGGRDFSNSVRNIRRADYWDGRQSLANSVSDNRRRTATPGNEPRGARSTADVPDRVRGNSATVGNGNRRSTLNGGNALRNSAALSRSTDNGNRSVRRSAIDSNRSTSGSRAVSSANGEERRIRSTRDNSDNSDNRDNSNNSDNRVARGRTTDATTSRANALAPNSRSAASLQQSLSNVVIPSRNTSNRASNSTTLNRETRTNRDSSAALTNRSVRAPEQSNRAAISRENIQPRNTARLNTERRSSNALRSSQEARRAISNTPRLRSDSSSNVRAAPSYNPSRQISQPSARRSASAPERRAAPSRSSRQSFDGSSNRPRASSPSRSTRSAAPSRSARSAPSRGASAASRGSSDRRRPG
ncbi:MAG: DUF3300 domain-containing protein [Gammaproteobacteria bacterium]|nr:DUF3300 domain-containing protein [Pseudomonadales bacterium]